MSVARLPSSSFFFQAEDGIRDADVTGVQTCALPILLCSSREVARLSQNALCQSLNGSATTPIAAPAMTNRSEERRVGKECGEGRGRESAKEQRLNRPGRVEARDATVADIRGC